MMNSHLITSNDRWFLDKQMKDPVAQEIFKEGDTIVICAKCKTAQYETSWKMNADKCCSAGCNHDKMLTFNNFSPVIFQPQPIRNFQFRIHRERIPFALRLKSLDGYPIANILTVLFPLFIAIILFTQVYCKEILMYRVSNQCQKIQEKFVDLNEHNKEKWERLFNSLENKNENITDKDNKRSELIEFSETIQPLKKCIDCCEKLILPFFNIIYLLKHSGEKFTNVLNHVLYLISRFF